MGDNTESPSEIVSSNEEGSVATGGLGTEGADTGVADATDDTIPVDFETRKARPQNLTSISFTSLCSNM